MIEIADPVATAPGTDAVTLAGGRLETGPPRFLISYRTFASIPSR